MANFKFDVDADGIALITWDMPGKSMNVIDFALVDEVEALVEKVARSEEHTSELQSQSNLVCRLLLEKKNKSRFERLLWSNRNIVRAQCILASSQQRADHNIPFVRKRSRISSNVYIVSKDWIYTRSY